VGGEEPGEFRVGFAAQPRGGKLTFGRVNHGHGR
jgi:hypothetical protein